MLFVNAYVVAHTVIRVNHAQTDKETGLLGLGKGEPLLNAFSGMFLCHCRSYII